MSLRVRFLVYLVLAHLVFAGVALSAFRGQGLWLLVCEVLLALSLGAGLVLLRRLWRPLELVRTGAELIEEGDFTSRFAEGGPAEIDGLAKAYNRMVARLRQERTHLQEQHYFLDKVLEASPAGVLTFDFDGRIERINPGAVRLLGVGAADAVGRRPGELDSPLGRALEELESGQGRVVALGGRRRVRCRRAQFYDRGFAHGFALVEELTEELRQSERGAYEKVIRQLAHEVNNSVGAVSSLLHSCLNYQEQLRPEDRGDFSTAMRVAIDRAEHLNAFMQDFAELVKVPAPYRQPVDVGELLVAVERLLSAECRRRRIEWVREGGEAIGPVRMDRYQMEQVFLNIARNAIEAIGEEGRIYVRLGRREGRAFAVVEDTGSGIDATVREQLFTPFFSTKENGQGLGLTLVQEILTRHGFDYSLESGQGRTRFEILFK